MKLCYFNYFLKPKENILGVFNCKLKSITTFQMLSEDGVLVATNTRLIFCKVIGEHPHLLQAYEYKYITNLKLKDKGYLYYKYNGDPVKISNVDDEDMKKLVHIINNKDLNKIFI